MLQISTTELKSRLGTYLALVRAGETIDILLVTGVDPASEFLDDLRGL
jgi:antitoxin (DNA-binding transcriptional repressor) of toxin-antitoxin stability system